MTEYTLSTQDDYENLPFSNIGSTDCIVVTGSIEIDGRLPDADIYLHTGSALMAPSSHPHWYTIRGGHLHLLWDGGYRASLALGEGDGPHVHLHDWPPAHTPIPDNGPASETLRFVRHSNPADGAPPANNASFVYSDNTGDDVQAPQHYTWIGGELVAAGHTSAADIQSWDLLDILFPNNPHLWNAGKYLTRYGRKGDTSRRIVDLRKARAYLDRAIEIEGRR